MLRSVSLSVPPISPITKIAQKCPVSPHAAVAVRHVIVAASRSVALQYKPNTGNIAVCAVSPFPSVPLIPFSQILFLSLREDFSRKLSVVKLKNDSGYPKGAGNTINILLRDSKCPKCRISPHVIAAGSASRDRFLQRLLLQCHRLLLQCQIATIHCSMTIAT